MNVYKQPVTRNNTIRGLGITTNYLIAEGPLWVWKQENHCWKWRMSAGGKGAEIVTNFQYDGSEHSPDLFLYTRLKGETSQRIIEENKRILDRSRRWYVRQLTNMDRVGIKRFGRLPLQAFFDLWRKPIDPRELNLTRLQSPNQFRFEGDRHRFSVVLVWPEIWNDPKRLDWFARYCKKRIYLFSDYDSMFEDPEDEFVYLADVCS